MQRSLTQTSKSFGPQSSEGQAATYNISITDASNTFSLTGTVTTDGTIGVLQAANEARHTIDNVIPQIAALSWRDDDVRSMMRTIAGDTDFLLTSDVHSAEQTALAGKLESRK